MPHVRPLEVASPTKPALGGHTRRHGRGVVVECARTFRRTRRGTAQAAAGRTPARNRAVWPAARSAFCSTQYVTGDEGSLRRPSWRYNSLGAMNYWI